MSLFPSDIFLKSVQVKDGAIKFEHNGKKYKIKDAALDEYEGLTVLVDAGGEVVRSDKKIGKFNFQ